MASRGPRKFDEKLSSLLIARVYPLKASVWPKIGKPPRVTKSKREKTIREIRDLVTETLLKTKSSKEIFKDHQYKRQWHPKRGKPRGIAAKKSAFKKWYEKKITVRNCVYIFWQDSKCLYVGRTINGKHRPANHFKKKWFRKATRIDIYAFDLKRDVPRYECMRTHRHHPSESKIKPSRHKYYSRCPICETNREVKSEIKYLFRLR